MKKSADTMQVTSNASARVSWFAAKIRARQDQLGWNNEILAEKAGVSVPTVQRYRHGLPPRSQKDTLRGFCRAMDLSEKYLLDDTIPVLANPPLFPRFPLQTVETDHPLVEAVRSEATRRRISTADLSRRSGLTSFAVRQILQRLQPSVTTFSLTRLMLALGMDWDGLSRQYPKMLSGDLELNYDIDLSAYQADVMKEAPEGSDLGAGDESSRSQAVQAELASLKLRVETLERQHNAVAEFLHWVRGRLLPPPTPRQSVEDFLAPSYRR